MWDGPRHHRRTRIKNTFIEVSDSDSDDGLPGRPSLRASSAPGPETRGQPLPRPREAQAPGEPPPGGLVRGGSAAGSSRAAEGEAGESPHHAPDPLDGGLGVAGVAAAASRPERDAQIEPGAQNSSTFEPRVSPQSLTLGEAVRALMQEDAGCMFLVRGVNALGFESEELLRSHYSGYGQVRRVLVVHSKARCWSGGTLSSRTRLRPGSMAFVVMEDPDVVERIIYQVGREQTVAGKRVRVERFERSTFVESGGASTSLG